MYTIMFTHISIHIDENIDISVAFWLKISSTTAPWVNKSAAGMVRPLSRLQMVFLQQIQDIFFFPGIKCLSLEKTDPPRKQKGLTALEMALRDAALPSRRFLPGTLRIGEPFHGLGSMKELMSLIDVRYVPSFVLEIDGRYNSYYMKRE